jgi:hypothetical protein
MFVRIARQVYFFDFENAGRLASRTVFCGTPRENGDCPGRRATNGRHTHSLTRSHCRCSTARLFSAKCRKIDQLHAALLCAENCFALSLAMLARAEQIGVPQCSVGDRCAKCLSKLVCRSARLATVVPSVSGNCCAAVLGWRPLCQVSQQVGVPQCSVGDRCAKCLSKVRHWT